MKNYIQELLYEHNSVIIPSFGGFTAGYKPASIDHVQGVIFPPSKDLKFNRYLTINDGILVQHIWGCMNRDFQFVLYFTHCFLLS